MNIQEFRQQYPQYNSLPDVQLAQTLYDKYYKNQMTFHQFGRSFGLSDTVREEGAASTFADEYSKGVFRGFLDVGAGLLGTAEFLIPGKQESFIRTKQNILQAKERFTPTHEGAAAWSGRVLGEAIPIMATSLVAGYTGGGVAGALGKSTRLGQAFGAGGVAFAVEGDAAYENAKKHGATEWQAQTERILVGSINAYLESIQIGKLIDFHSAGKHTIQGFVRNVRNKAWDLVRGDIRNFSGEILKLAVEEGLQEAAQEGVSIGVPAALRGDYPKKDDGSPDYKAILTQIGEAGLGGAFAGTVLGGGGAFASATPSIAAPTTAEMQQTAKTIQESNLSPMEKVHLLRQLDMDVELTTTEGIKFAPEELTVTEQFKNKMDDVVVDIEQMRPLEKTEISEELGRRFSEFREIKNSVADPRQRIPIALQAMKGRLKQEIAPLQDKFTETEIDNAYDTVTTATLLNEGQQISAFEGLQKLLFDGVIPAKHELAQMERAGLLSKEAIQEILKNRTKMQKAWDFIKDLSFAPWSLLTAIDVSAAGRQGWRVFFQDPGMWLRAVGRGYRAFASEKYFKFVELRRKTHPLYTEAVKRGVDETSLDTIERGEELFASNMVQKIPGIRASGRAFVTIANELRFGWYFKGKELAGSGLTSSQQKELATFANDITGRGKLPKALQKLQDVGLIFFAPRLVTSQIRLVTADLIPSRKELKTQQFSPARKMLAGTLVKFLAFTLATLYLFDRDDKDNIDVDWDPRSSDFLKVRHGKTRIDITGGYQPLLRALIQTTVGQRKSTESGRVYNVERTEIISRFLQSKLSPHAGLAVDLWRGETFLGDKLTLAPSDVAKQVYNRLTPLFIQDVADAMRYQGLSTTAIVAPLAWHGVGVQTYPSTLTQEAQSYKDRLAKQYFGVGWDDLGPEAEKAIRTEYPEIALREAEAKIDRDDFSFVGTLLAEADKTGRYVTDSLNKTTQEELRKYALDAGNIGRNIGSGWYLNDTRYKQYQKDLIVLLNTYMPKLINSNMYQRLEPLERRAILKKAIDELKKYGRMKLITEANYTDLQRREEILRKR